ncbi:hypothetical protein [Streptomyces sp. WY228]|uniref:hypothetical protein n=1 Tax=Streptomyces sp. WY228 TaxID=2855836 RepID=UPI001C4E8637|nr:hypothetical protein [Streptomyces sp. WY228]QXQ94867.1 hypothetical protein KV381_00035 [Streptomyces sp. WY228]
MNPDPHVIISAAVPNPNPYPILISGVAFNVIVVLVSAWRTRRHAERLHRETLAAQRDELETKARHDLAAERREAQRKAHGVFLRAVAALDAAAYGYAARPHNKPSQALPERLTLWEDTDGMVKRLTDELRALAEAASTALEDVRLASSEGLTRQATTVFHAAVLAANQAEWVGRIWAKHPDIWLEAAAADSGRMVDAPKVAEQREKYETRRSTYRRERDAFVAAFQTAMWDAT